MSTGDNGSWASGAFDAMKNAAQDAAGATADVMTELTSFTKFQKRIDQLIHDLKQSPASAHQVGMDQPTRASYGGASGWSPADALHTAHTTVVESLEELSKLVSDSIEGMGLAVLASHQGYGNVDADVRDRLNAIHAEAKKNFGGEYRPDLPRQAGEHGAGQDRAKPSPEASGSGTAGDI
ncbi:hypothetical protein ACIRF8_03245 [Streptomyces sp. NPDC102406]|uniref:hypothetical protein n=1 Tax=Streptomyces sp. NPDC102406 TaxID=3366171 RepID=UPI00381EC866